MHLVDVINEPRLLFIAKYADDAASESLTTLVSTPRPTPQASYVVQPGDTLLGIAIRYDVAMARIQIENDLGESRTYAADRPWSSPPKRSPTNSRFGAPEWSNRRHTLSSIADEAGVSVADLGRVNSLGGAR